MKLTNTLGVAPKTKGALTPQPNWVAEKNGHVWEVESEEFDNWSSQAHEITERIERLQTQLEEALQHIREMSTRVATNSTDDVVMSGGGFEVTVKRRSQNRWDTAKLEDIFSDMTDLPAHVKKNLGVDKKVYERLSEHEKEELRPALEIVQQKSAVKVRRK